MFYILQNQCLLKTKTVLIIVFSDSKIRCNFEVFSYSFQGPEVKNNSIYLINKYFFCIKNKMLNILSPTSSKSEFFISSRILDTFVFKFFIS